MALTVSSGAVDAISFIALGKVFTAFMTGNVVFLALGAASAFGANGPNIVRVATALAAFSAGVFLSTRIAKASKGAGLWPSGASLALAAAAVAQTTFLVGWVVASGRPSTGFGTWLTAIVALAMGLQSGAVLLLGLRGVFTTAATATVMFLARDAAARPASTAEPAMLAGVLVSLFAGATAGGLLLVHARIYAPALPPVLTLLVVAAASLALRDGPAEGEGTKPARGPLE
jgi:uncharacterized membrane protein YoaK (UPF0700 family)